MLHVIPDTNIFLHYKFPDQIDLAQAFGAKAVRISVPPVVLRELSKQKDMHAFKRLRRRAADALKKLDGYAQGQLPVRLQGSVDLDFITKDPLLDFVSLGLSRDVQDDWLIASALEFRQNSPGSEVVLLTADVGLKLKARAHSLRAESLPDVFKLPDVPDDTERHLNDLTRQLKEMEAAAPSLVLAFSGALKRIEVSLSPAPAPLDEAVMEERIRAQRAYLLAPTSPGPLALLGIVNSQYETTRYKQAVDRYCDKYREYLVADSRYEDRASRTIELNLELSNTGRQPAEDIDITMHFPDGLRPGNKEGKPGRPQEPSPPDPLGSAFGAVGPIVPPGLSSLWKGNRPIHVPNVSSFHIRKTKSYEVTAHVGRLKHSMTVSLDALYLCFDSFDGAGSFGIPFLINAGNMQNVVEGRLDVVISKSTRPASTEESGI